MQIQEVEEQEAAEGAETRGGNGKANYACNARAHAWAKQGRCCQATRPVEGRYKGIGQPAHASKRQALPRLP